ncbi:hypothetical protein [Endozoicomonas sp. ONNA2]|uniref:hypothetical protein n=1 Tax=Endozoicomonas sp. ONNA2 TaxID=2828741 RepID=UPI0021486AE2|nr:hypothetical protein [Endozoicomonas sp. ONNA2]
MLIIIATQSFYTQKTSGQYIIRNCSGTTASFYSAREDVAASCPTTRALIQQLTASLAGDNVSAFPVGDTFLSPPLATAARQSCQGMV